MTRLGTDSARFPVAIPGREGPGVVLAWAALSDVGHRRAANEDSVITTVPIFAVADGMGGHAAGDLASAAVVERLAGIARGGYTDVASLEEALVAASRDIDELPVDDLIGVGTTVSGAALVLQGLDPYFAVFNVGDSRVYRFSGHELTQVTVDHSVVQELVDAGMLTPEQAERHPESNVITRAIGFRERPQPDYWLVPAKARTRLVVCSDGLTKEIPGEEMRRHLDAWSSPAETVAALMDAALAAGGRDNVTLVVIDVVEAPSELELEPTIPRSGVRGR